MTRQDRNPHNQSAPSLVSYALGEIEATAKKAARGAGYHWGEAEDSSKAVRWLQTYGFNGCLALAQTLAQGFAQDDDAHKHSPEVLTANWQSASGALLCPLKTGMALSDFCFRFYKEQITILSLAQPLLILPFIAFCAHRLGQSFRLDCDGALVHLSYDKISCDEAALKVLQQPLAQKLVVSISAQQHEAFAASAENIRKAQFMRAELKPEDFASLNHFAQKTYAPATEESRILGAGAGLNDND